MKNKTIAQLFPALILTCLVQIAFAQTPCGVDKENLIRHVYLLASDSLEGRETGEPGQKKAADYIAREFLEIGLKPFVSDTGFFQTFYLYDRVAGKVEFSGLRREVPALSFHSGYQQEGDSCVFIFQDHRSPIDHARIDADRAFLLINPKNARQTRKQIHRRHAEGIRRFVIIAEGSPWASLTWRERFPGRRHSLEPVSTPSKLERIIAESDSVLVVVIRQREMSQIIGYRPDIDMLQQQVKRHGAAVQLGAPLMYRHTPAYTDSMATENVVGMIEGKRGTDQMVVITAHYDHIGIEDDTINPGADDNASGTAALIEIARVLKCMQDSGKVFEKSVLFVAFSAEEIGLLGSRYFVTSEPFVQTKPLLNINMDMIGRSIRYRTMQAMVMRSSSEDQEEDTTLRESYVFLTVIGKGIGQFADYATEIAAEDHPGFVIDRNPGLLGRLSYRGGSDHASFVDKGIPALVWFTGLHPDYHTPRDTPEKIDYSNLTRVTDVILKTTLRIISP